MPTEANGVQILNYHQGHSRIQYGSKLPRKEECRGKSLSVRAASDREQLQQQFATKKGRVFAAFLPAFLSSPIQLSREARKEKPMTC